MNEELRERFKQLVGESKTEDKKPLLSEEFVTDKKLSNTLSEKENKNKEELSSLNESVKAIESDWLDEGVERKGLISEGVVSESQEECGHCNGMGKQHSEDEEGSCDYCGGSGDQEKDTNDEESINESKNIMYNLSFLDKK